MKRIPLTNSNLFFIVDDEDYAEVSSHAWFLNGGYPSRSTYPNGKVYQQRLHRQLLGLEPYNKMTGDHINGDKLDNRRSNLRACTQGQNNCNARRSSNKSGYHGVSWKKSAQKWCAQIKSDGRVLHLGLFDDPKEAAGVYNAYAVHYHGNFAILNEVTE